MSAIETFLKGKSKSLYYWWKLFIEGFKTKEEIVNNDWKGVKLQSSYYPPLFPKKNLNNVSVYLELEWNGKLIKRL